MHPMITTISLSLPNWIDTFLAVRPSVFPTRASRMQLAIDLSAENSAQGTGGPFGSAIFESDSGRLVSVGVNRVVPEKSSCAHGEVMAILMAQASLNSFDLGAQGFPPHELHTSAQMCGMCLGAVLWSGVRSVVFGASRDDVLTLTGFDEGPIHPQWETEFASRGISVFGPFLQAEAATVLKHYATLGGTIYNSRNSSK